MMLEAAIALLLLGVTVGYATARLVYREMLNIQAKRLDLARREARAWEDRARLVSRLMDALLKVERQRLQAERGEGAAPPTPLRVVKP